MIFFLFACRTKSGQIKIGGAQNCRYPGGTRTSSEMLRAQTDRRCVFMFFFFGNDWNMTRVTATAAQLAAQQIVV